MRSLSRLERAHEQLLLEIDWRFGIRIEAEQACLLRTPEALAEELARRGALDGTRSAPSRSASEAAVRNALAEALDPGAAAAEPEASIERIFGARSAAWEGFCAALQLDPRRSLPRFLRRALTTLPFAPVLVTALTRLADPLRTPLPSFAPALGAGAALALIGLWLGTRKALRRALPHLRLAEIVAEHWWRAIEAQVAQGSFSPDEARAWLEALGEIALEGEAWPTSKSGKAKRGALDLGSA